ncbi:MAG: TetR/AcrR family transcriptional regulator [Leifsonia sp.]|jgi:AcrR family transcriptional regulator
MSPKQRIRLTPEERITQILDAAERVFGESGFRQGSFKDVADAVGLTLQGVLHYFGTKEDLLRATLDRRNAGQVVIGERIGQEQGAIAFMRYYLERNEEHPGFRRLFVTLAAEATDPEHPAHDYFSQRYARTSAALTDIIRNDIESGRMDGAVDPTRAAAAIIALADGLQLQKLLVPSLDLLAAYDAATAGFLKH